MTTQSPLASQPSTIPVDQVSQPDDDPPPAPSAPARSRPIERDLEPEDHLVDLRCRHGSESPQSPEWNAPEAFRRHTASNAWRPVAQTCGALWLKPDQAEMLHEASLSIAHGGGPQVPGAQRLVATAAAAIGAQLDRHQARAARRFGQGASYALRLSGLPVPDAGHPPLELPTRAQLEQDPALLYLAARSQICLLIAGHRAFAFDGDNDGKLVRLVANFNGGGRVALPGEQSSRVELSSHSGRSLGEHTEAPYHCCVHPHGSHSPAPSSLILTARYNPLGEPTSIVPLAPILERLGIHLAHALTLPVFNFSRSDSFSSGRAGGEGVSILEFDEYGGFLVRYNDYRFTAGAGAPAIAVAALLRLREEIRRARPLRVTLQSDCAILINNQRALHARDVVQDNRRLLVRLFGYDGRTTGRLLNGDPLVYRL